MPKVSRIKVTDLKSDVLKVIDELGGISNFIKTGESVLLKPNFNTGDPFPASTDSTFLATIVGICFETGASKVIIGESSNFMHSSSKIFALKGVEKLIQKYPKVEFQNFNNGKWINIKIPNAKFLSSASIPEIIEQVDRIIYLPCLKTHSMGQFTGSLKLSVGILKPIERIPLHVNHLQEKIAELNTLISPDLIIMDARKCFINGGPAKGEVREPNIILASTRRIAIDTEGVRIIQQYEGNSLSNIKAEDITQIKHAKEVGLS